MAAFYLSIIYLNIYFRMSVCVRTTFKMPRGWGVDVTHMVTVRQNIK